MRSMPLIFTLARNLLLTVILEGIPVALIFIFMQKYYIEGIASSGIKG